jgi:hypothetical protein
MSKHLAKVLTALAMVNPAILAVERQVAKTPVGGCPKASRLRR